MKTRWRRVVMGLGLVLALASASAAQEQPAKAELGLELQGGTRIAWYGPRPDGAELLASIAAARVALDVEGNLAAVTERLMELSLQAAAAQGFAQQTEALVQAALARSALQQRLGDLAQAVEELRQVLPAPPARFVTTGKIELGAATPSLLQALEKARSDARVTQALAELERRSKELAPGTESLAAFVDERFAQHDYDEIAAVGRPAFERFAERVLGSAASFPTNVDLEPLLYLIQTDERRAARFLAQNLDGHGPLWPKRILRAMAVRQVLENDGTWTHSRPFVCLEPEWLELVERLLAERETAQDALPFFASIERRDALTDGLNAAFARALESYGPDFATLAMQAFDHEGVVASAQPALEAALALPDVRLRRFAAEKLVNFPRSEALLGRAKDGDVEVRRQVVKALEPRGGQYFVLGWASPDSRSLGERVAERDAATVRVLLSDEDAGIRASAVALLDALERPLEEALYLRLCGDPAPEVRHALLGLTRLAPAIRGRMLALLARDPAPQVIRGLDNVLDNNFGFSGPISTAPRPFLEALEARWKDREHPLAANLRQKLLRSLLETAEGTRALVAWMLSAPQADELATLNAWAKVEHLLALPDELLARLLATSDVPQVWEKPWAALRAEPLKRIERPAAMRLLLADEKAPRRVRLSAARLAADESPAFRKAFLGLLRDPSWKELAPNTDERQQLRACGGTFEPAARNALMLEVLNDRAIAAEVADAFVSAYLPESPGGRELAEAVLARWLRPGAPWRDSVEATLYRLGQVPELARTELLEQALPAYPDAVVETLGELADAKFLPLLRRAMRAEWLPANQRDDLQRTVAYALGAFDEDEAVELLLEGLRSNDDRVREACLASLERIKTYRGQIESWRGQARATPTKESALGELLAMLADTDPLVRKEAARGLGALGAVEALPDLIHALKDGDAAVRAAAQAALDRLDAGGGSGSPPR